MKLILAVNSENNYDKIADQTFRLIGRIGYVSKIFVPIKQARKYRRAIEDANYNYYLPISKNNLITGQNPRDHATRHGVDLLVTVPDDLEIPIGKAEDRYLLAFSRKIEQARAGFEQGKYKKKKTIGSGVVMEKVL